MHGLPVRAQGFIIGLLLAGACIGGAALAGASTAVSWDSTQWAQTICVVCFVALLSHHRTPLPTHNIKGSVQSMGSAGHMAALVIFPLPLAITISAGGLLLEHIVDRRPPVKTVFNVSMNLLTVAVAGSVLLALGGPHVLAPSAQVGLLGLFAICLTAVVYYCVHVPLYAVFFAYLNGRRVEYTFRVNFRASIIPEMVSIFIGVIAGLLWRYSPPMILLIAMPVIITHISFQSIRRLQEETIAAVRALADSIDIRDPYTAQHSVRVATMARRLAEVLALSDDTVEQIYLAAQVHDLGKMTVPVEVLGKHGSLTPEEKAIMEQHPVTGAAVLSRYKGFGSSVPIVLHHHERWDGCGYPDGLSETAIPLGARIIALADTFDAMTSDRPYRKGLAPARALSIMAGEAGTQFDPALAARFVAMLEADYQKAPSDPVIWTEPSVQAAGRAPVSTLVAAASLPPRPVAADLGLPLAIRGFLPMSSATAYVPPSGVRKGER